MRTHRALLTTILSHLNAGKDWRQELARMQIENELAEQLRKTGDREVAVYIERALRGEQPEKILTDQQASGRWRARVGAKGTYQHVGVYETQEQASQAAEEFLRTGTVRRPPHPQRSKMREIQKLSVEKRRRQKQDAAAAT